MGKITTRGVNARAIAVVDRLGRETATGPLQGGVSGRVRATLLSILLPAEFTIQVGRLRATFLITSRFELEALHAYRREPDGAMLADLLDLLQPDDVVWDVGANVGVVTCFAAQRLGPDQVVAIEPVPRTVDRLRHNLEINGCGGTVFRYALGSTTGQASLQQTGPPVAGTFARVTDDQETGLTVPVIPGDELTTVWDIPAPTVLKIDVQGAEYDVLQGLDQRLTQDCRALYLNIYEKHFSAPDDGAAIRGFVTDRGFRVDRQWDWSGGQIVRAMRRN